MATKYYQEKNERFVNPYHFVQLAKQLEDKFNYVEQKNAGDLTGWLECALTTKTPIFIPNRTKEFANDVTVLDDERKPKPVSMPAYDFFSYTDLSGMETNSLDAVSPGEPVIPGSEIRGMTRSAFEAVTHSCLSSIDDEKVLYKRVQWPGKPGRLINDKGEWKIQPCKKHKVKVAEYNPSGLPTAHPLADLKKWYQQTRTIGVWFKFRTLSQHESEVTTLTPKPPANIHGWRRGYLCVGEPFEDRKKHEYIFEVEQTSVISVPPEAVENFRQNVKLYRDLRVNTHHKGNSPKKAHPHSGYAHIEDIDGNLDGMLIYYADYNRRYYLSPAAIGRHVFYKRLGMLIDGFEPCSKVTAVCDACALFGLAGRDEAAASRVRFTDAIREQDEQRRAPAAQLYDAPRILKELASPKLSATEFYLQKPPGEHNHDADLWNYDYALRWRRNKHGRNKDWTNNRGGLEHDFPKYQARIRGRKFYWHHQNPVQAYVTEDDLRTKIESASDRNVQVRPLKQDVTFSFRIYFNNITQKELDKLLWVIEIGGHQETHAHKIGMGKPLGLGSVQLRVTAIKQRTVSIENDAVKYIADALEGTANGQLDAYKKQRYADIESDIQSKLGTTRAVLDDFLALTNFDEARDNVRYPYNKDRRHDETATYNWFVGNKQAQNNKATGTAPAINQPLPDITSPKAPELEIYQES